MLLVEFGDDLVDVDFGFVIAGLEQLQLIDLLLEEGEGVAGI